jgi:heme-degrading monooxygenase HmoA
MSEIYTTGRWKPNTGKEDAFARAWADFAAWASTMRGAGTLRLARDVRDVEIFVSFGRWNSIEAVRAWKSAPDFRDGIARVLQHVAEFEPTELAVVATAEAGRATTNLGAAAGVEPAHAP